MVYAYDDELGTVAAWFLSCRIRTKEKKKVACGTFNLLSHAGAWSRWIACCICTAQWTCGDHAPLYVQTCSMDISIFL